MDSYKIKGHIVAAIFVFVSAYSFAQLPSKSPNDKLPASNISNSIQKGSKSLEQIDVNNLISIDKSGDASLSIPIVNVKGRVLNFPIALNYQAGIKVDQKASEVGLGWNINFGSIVRDYGAFEPDYTATSAETGMKNTSNASFAPGTLTAPSSLTAELPTSNNKNLIYNAVNPDNLTPDDYHVVAPGLGSGTFWNGALDGPHSFVFSDANPWALNFTKKTFQVCQEFSRINELAYQKSGTNLINQGRNIAAAICVPPYVINRDFTDWVVKLKTTSLNSPAIVGTQYNFPYNEKVKYEDFSSFSITSEDGTVYVFGRPLRGQKYLFTEDPYWSTVGASAEALESIPNNAIYGEWWKIDYIAEWLLTEIRSYDYADSNDNGMADDGDAGDWIRIEYTAPTQVEKIPGMNYAIVPKHREWMNYTQTDKASSLMRERAYVTKIVTPVQQIDFTISKRYDIDKDYFKTPLNWIHNTDYVYSNTFVGSPSEKLEVNYPTETMKYDQLTIKERVNDQTLNTIKFVYAAKGSANELAVSDYIIRSNDDQETIPYDPANTSQLLDVTKYDTKGVNNPYHTGRGKTTLIGIDFFPQDNLTSSEKQSFKFEYAYNPSFSAIHKHEIEYMASYPNLRQSLVEVDRGKDLSLVLSPYKYWSFEVDANGNAGESITSSTAFMDDMGNYLDINAPNKGRHAWSLSKLVLPTGGSIALEYENDQFDLDADRIGWKSVGSIIDDQLPHVANYNKIAIARSFRQSQITGTYNGPYVKHKSRTFNMPMNLESGGLRLKKKTIDDGINPAVVINYAYGTGHYSAVPASYWSNYIAAFGYFMSSEQVRNNSEISWYVPDVEQSWWFWGTDFASFMSELSFNIRLDNTVNDNHYYTYIDEINADNSKTRYSYGDPSATTSALFYNIQKQVYLKGYERRNLVMGLINVRDAAHEIKLLKTENFSGNFSNLVSYSQLNYSFEPLATKQISFQSLNLPVTTYPIYYNHSGFGNKLSVYFPNDAQIVLAISTLRIIDPVHPNLAISEIMNIGNSTQYYSVKDDGYAIADGIYTNRQAVRTTLNSQTNYYKGVLTTTNYTYEMNGLVKTILNRNSTKTISYPDFTPESVPESKLTQYKYAYESYASLNNVFLQRNMLTQKSGVSTYSGNSTSNSSILTANVQTWSTSGIPCPDKAYEYVGSIDDYFGQMVNYSNFNYTPNATNSSNWLLRNTSLEFNRFGQQTLQRTNDIYTKSVMGYNSETPKATIKYTGGWFDATYTGFEDADGISPNKYNSYILQTGGTSCGSQFKYYVNNSTNAFAVGDVVTITPNPLLNSCPEFTTWGPSYNLAPFTATISGITLEGAYPGPQFVYSCLGMSGIFDDYKTVLCFKDPIDFRSGMTGATISIRSKAKEPLINVKLPEFWYNTNTTDVSKVVTSSKTTYVRTGNKSFYLSSSTSGTPPYQRTPVRPVLIKAADCPVGPCTMAYKASCWIRNDLPGIPPITGTTTLYFTYTLNNSTHTAQIGGASSVFLSTITNQWQYFEIDIPITKTSSDQLLDVYLENPTINSTEKIYIDDFLVYPQGAKYEYNSFDRFLNTLAYTDANDKTATTVYDVWGRPSLMFDANGSMLSSHSYFTTSNIALFHNYYDVTNWIDGSTFKQTRSFLDGTGKPKETCIYDPVLNRRLISVIDYDNQGRPIKNYNPYGETGN